MEPPSGHSRYISKEERSYLSKLCAAMQNRVEVPVVRMWLQQAEAEGLDPRRIYDVAVKVRLPHWDPAPPFEIINPVWG